jgi:adenosine deaminase
VHEAIDLGADRIGHGISLFRDAALVQLVQTRNIHIEFCPSSNLATGSVLSLRQHPIQKARALGLSYSVNTDDPGTFECSMESEYALLADQLGFTEADFQTIARNTLEARFVKQLRYQNTLNLA